MNNKSQDKKNKKNFHLFFAIETLKIKYFCLNLLIFRKFVNHSLNSATLSLQSIYILNTYNFRADDNENLANF